MALKQLVSKKMKADKLDSVSAAAKKIGVTPQSLKGIVEGKSLPNARSLSKYAKFLGKSEAELQKQVDAEKAKSGKRPGRPPSKKTGAKKGPKRTAGRPRKTAAKTSAKRGSGRPRKTGAKAKTTKRAGRPRKSTTTTAQKAGSSVDGRVLRSLRADLKKLNQLQRKIEASLKKIA